MLFAGRQRQHVAAPPLLVLGFADQPAGHLPNILLQRREQPAVGSAEAQRDAERLSFADDDVGSAAPGDFKKPEADRLGYRDDQQSARIVRGIGDCLRSSMQPKKFGDCTTTAAVSLSIPSEPGSSVPASV